MIKIGDKFTRLSVIDRGPANSGKVKCRCECGTVKLVSKWSLKIGEIKSCGCLKLKHGHASATVKSRTYIKWTKMKHRCTNKNASDYPRYGGIGIKVCDRWLESFNNFLEDMGEVPDGLSIDRVDPFGNYEPSNCRWADQKTQDRNRRGTVYLTVDGVKRPMREWAEISGTNFQTMYQRLKDLGWTDHKEIVFTKRFGIKHKRK